MPIAQLGGCLHMLLAAAAADCHTVAAATSTEGVVVIGGDTARHGDVPWAPQGGQCDHTPQG
jgi:hypothetical protein